MRLADLKDLYPLLTAMIAAGATLLAVMVSNHFNLRVAKLNNDSQSRQSAAELRLAKLEELYTLFDQWQLYLANLYLLHLRCYKGKLTYSQVCDLVLKSDKLKNGEAQRYLMLMEIYFPTLRPNYGPVEEARKRLAPFIDDPVKTKLNAEDLIRLQEEFEQACRAFKDDISTLAKEVLT